MFGISGGRGRSEYASGHVAGRGLCSGRRPGWRRRDGDWPCLKSSCGNVNYVMSNKCHKCGCIKQCDYNCAEFYDNSTIYISNLPKDVTIDELKVLFQSTGQIARIKLDTDDQGSNKGDVVLSYKDPRVAHIALRFFNNCDLRGHKISVTMATKSAPEALAEFDRGVDVERSFVHGEIQEIVEEDAQMGCRPLVSSLAFLKDTFNIQAVSSTFVRGLVLALGAGCYTYIEKYFQSSDSHDSTPSFPTFPT